MISVTSFSSPLTTHSVTLFFFFFNDTATTEIYTLSLHDALPIFLETPCHPRPLPVVHHAQHRSEEHTSELQSQSNIVCRLLLEKKKIEIIHCKFKQFKTTCYVFTSSITYI